jgi:hypothetical protein
MFEQKRVCGDGSYTTWAEELREGNQHVNGEDEEFAHAANATMTAIACNTARYKRIPSYCEFASHRFRWFVHVNQRRRILRARRGASPNPTIAKRSGISRSP